MSSLKQPTAEPHTPTFGTGSSLRFARDEDLLRFEPNLDEVYPRLAEDGTFLRTWDQHHGQAMRWCERELRARRTYAEPFQLGRVGLRSQDHLREAVAAYALHLIYVAIDTQGHGGIYDTKAGHYLRMARDIVQAESVALDYDESGDGTIGDGEKQRPIASMFIRG